jgi:receptor protein-tyrosine kinase
VLVTVPDDSTGASRSVAQLRAHVISTHAGRGRMALMFTSFSERSSPCAALRLAKALADTGRRVVLVDADITGGGSSALLGMKSAPGLSEWLRGLHTPVEELPRWHGTEVNVLPLGSVDERTPDHVASTQVADLLSLLRDHFDYIIVDAAPVLADPAALTLSAHCDATVAVVDFGTRATSVRSAAAAFRASGSGLLGAVGVAGICTGVPPDTKPKGHPLLASDERLVHTRTPRS